MITGGPPHRNLPQRRAAAGTRLRRLSAGAVAALVTACTASPAPAPAWSQPRAAAPGVRLNPANIKRVAAELPPGYEVTAVTGPSSPPGGWGLGAGWAVHPPQCGALADALRGRQGPTQGMSGSGPGGIVYAVVARSRAGPVSVDPADVESCREWVMDAGRVSARVHLVDPPRIQGVTTVAMAADTSTLVEGGGRVDSRAETATAYLGDYWVFTTLVVDPGSPGPELRQRFAADLLVKAVSVLRG